MKPLIEFEHPITEQEIARSLPLTRKAAFKDILRHHYQTFLWIGGTLLVFLVPFLANLSIANMRFDNIYTQFINEEITKVAYLESALSIYLVELLGSGASLLLLSLPLALFSKTYRSICFYDVFFPQEEIKKGFKQNFLHCFLGVLILVICALGSSILVLFVDFGGFNNNWVVSILSFLPLTVTLVFLLPTVLTFFVLTTIYNTSLGKGLVSAFKIYLNSFFPLLGLSLTTLLPLLAVFIPNSLIANIVIVISIIAYYPVIFLAIWLYLLSRFDKFINHESYPSLYQKGLFI